MKASKLAALFLVSLLPLAACKSHEADMGDNTADAATSAQNSATGPADQGSQSSAGATTQTTEQEIAGTSNPNDLNPVKAQTMDRRRDDRPQGGRRHDSQRRPGG